jgi:hypothetical protein
MKETVKVTKTSLLGDIESNLTREEMAAKYGISKQSIAKVLAQAGFKGVRVKTPAYIFIDDTIEPETSVAQEPIVNDGFTPNYAGMTQNFNSIAQL